MGTSKHSDDSYNFRRRNNGGAGSGGAGGNDECTGLTISGELQNINRDAMREVEPGDLLEIQINPITKVPEVLNKFGNRCGNIVSNKASELRDCIEAGNTFKAAVESVRGDQCQVTVERAA